MNKKKCIPKRDNRGVVMAELALGIPLLLVVMFVIIELGNTIYISNSINQVARTAARYAATNENYTISDVKDYATLHGVDYVVPDISLLNLGISPTPGTQNVGDIIIVTVVYAYVPFVNPFGLLGSNQSWSPTLVARAISRSEVGS